MATHLGIKYIQLPQPHTRAPTTSNWHHEIREYQSHPIAMTTQLGNQSRRTATTTHAGTNHIQLAQPTSWVPISSNCHATHFGIKHIQLPQPHTRAPTTSNWHLEIREYQSHPIAMTTQLGNQSRRTATTTHAGTNHIQLAQPTSCVPISTNCHATHFGIKHIQLPQPHTRAPTTSNWHHQTRGHQSYPIATAKSMGTYHIQ